MKHQKFILKKDTERYKIMYKYAQLKRFHHDRRLQVYRYAFVYVYTQPMPVEDHFSDRKLLFLNYKNISTTVTVPKAVVWIWFHVFRRI